MLCKIQYSVKSVLSWGSGVLWGIIAVGLGIGIFNQTDCSVTLEISSNEKQIAGQCFYSEHSSGFFSEKNSVRNNIAVKSPKEFLTFQLPPLRRTIKSLRFDWDNHAAPIGIKSISLQQGGCVYRLSGNMLAEVIVGKLRNAHMTGEEDGWIYLTADRSDPGFFLTGDWRECAEKTWRNPWKTLKITPLSWKTFGSFIIWEGILFIFWFLFLALIDFSTVENWKKIIAQFNNTRCFWLLAVFFLLISLGIFSIYFCQNSGARLYDEIGYTNLAIQLFQREPWALVANYRTYLYVGILAFGYLLVGIDYLKPFIAILQYLFLFGSCVYILKCIYQIASPKRLGWIFALTGGAIICNPYLIQSTTLLLTDLVAACLVGVAFYAFIFQPYSVRNSILVPLMMVIAGMIRPAMFYFLFAFFILYIIKFYRETKKHSLYAFLKPVPIALLLCCLCCFPQFIWLKQLSPEEFRFPIVRQLGSIQMTWGMKYLKYGTYVGSERSPKVFFNNPFYDASIKSSGEFYRKKPLSAVLTCACHILSMIDQGEINTYMRSLDSWPRKIASFFSYLFWYIILLGILLFFRLRRSKIVSGMVLLQLGIPILIYLACCSTTAVESRFIYPVLLLLPYFFYGGCRMMQEWLRDPLHRRVRLSLIVVGAIIFEAAFYVYSYWLDSLIS